jgi:hypothetical protein
MEPITARQRPIGLAAYATREWFSRVEPTAGLPTAQTTGMRSGHANPIGIFYQRGPSCIVHAFERSTLCAVRAKASPSFVRARAFSVFELVRRLRFGYPCQRSPTRRGGSE